MRVCIHSIDIDVDITGVDEGIRRTEHSAVLQAMVRVRALPSNHISLHK